MRFVYDARRVTALGVEGLVRLPDSRRKEKRLFVGDLDRALGVPPGTAADWLRWGCLPPPAFPSPSGHGHTVQEVLVLLHVLAVQTGSRPTDEPFKEYPRLAILLAMARQRIVDREAPAWRTTIRSPVGSPLNPAPPSKTSSAPPRRKSRRKNTAGATSTRTL
jgi:hypothetical protein